MPFLEGWYAMKAGDLAPPMTHPPTPRTKLKLCPYEEVSVPGIQLRDSAGL
jgi:hypothetical protein